MLSIGLDVLNLGTRLQSRHYQNSKFCPKEERWTGKYVRRGGVLPAMMTSLAFPERRVFRVLLYPKVTAENVVSVDEAFELGDPQRMDC